MNVYIDVAIHKWYSGIQSYWNQIQEMYRDTGTKRTMVVCFGDLSDPSKETDLFYEVMDWLFPGGHEYTFPTRHPHPYKGGHSTSHNATLRSNLTLLVKQLDAQVFNHSLSKLHALFECGSET